MTVLYALVLCLSFCVSKLELDLSLSYNLARLSLSLLNYYNLFMEN